MNMQTKAIKARTGSAAPIRKAGIILAVLTGMQLLGIRVPERM